MRSMGEVAPSGDGGGATSTCANGDEASAQAAPPPSAFADTSPTFGRGGPDCGLHARCELGPRLRGDDSCGWVVLLGRSCVPDAIPSASWDPIISLHKVRVGLQLSLGMDGEGADANEGLRIESWVPRLWGDNSC